MNLWESGQPKDPRGLPPLWLTASADRPQGVPDLKQGFGRGISCPLLIGRQIGDRFQRPDHVGFRDDDVPVLKIFRPNVSTGAPIKIEG